MYYNTLSEVDKINLRRSNEGELVSRWHSCKHELCYIGLTEAEGLIEMKKLQEKAIKAYHHNDDLVFGEAYRF